MAQTKALRWSTAGGADNTLSCNAGIENIFVSNVSNADVLFSLKFAASDVNFEIVAGLKIPARTSIDILNGSTLRLKNGKGGIAVTAVDGSAANNSVDVIYTSF
tara:strand:- start:174 stop:485 length:312 start_codon:yes stop_codon:yes gene_type:complete